MNKCERSTGLRTPKSTCAGDREPTTSWKGRLQQIAWEGSVTRFARRGIPCGLTAAKAFQELCSTAESLRGPRCSREKAAMWALPD